MTDNSDNEVVLEKIPYIHYPVGFQEDQERVKTLFDNGSKVNTMSPAYIKKLGLKTQKTNVGAQKIDGSTLETIKMVITNF